MSKAAALVGPVAVAPVQALHMNVHELDSRPKTMLANPLPLQALVKQHHLQNQKRTCSLLSSAFLAQCGDHMQTGCSSALFIGAELLAWKAPTGKCAYSEPVNIPTSMLCLRTWYSPSSSGRIMSRIWSSAFSMLLCMSRMLRVLCLSITSCACIAVISAASGQWWRQCC
jgi:hypothetical protein